MLANVYALLHRLFGSPQEAILKNHEKAREMLRSGTIPGLDPVKADMMMAEVQTAVEEMLSSIEEMTGVRKKPGVTASLSVIFYSFLPNLTESESRD